MKTVLITGCSSGYGLATARFFHDRGWSVVATMRTPKLEVLPPSVRVLALDVTDPDSIAAADDDAGPIDVLVNNAGIGAFGPLESTPMSIVRQVFETNTFGVIATTQAFLPGLRERSTGVVVNVTSSATLVPMPLVATYTASKTAVEGFTGSLALELAQLGIRAKLVEPGYGPSTAFGSNTGERITASFPEAYAPFLAQVSQAFSSPELVTHESDVAEAVYRAATDTTETLRFPAGADALALSEQRS